MSIRKIVKDWLPPAFTRAIKNYSGAYNLYIGGYRTWEEARDDCTGYEAENILSKVLDATLKVKRGQAAFERDSVVFNELELAWSVTTAVLWAAACSNGRLNVLDFGGSLGSSYFQNLKVIRDLPSVRWNVVEQPHYVDVGRRYIQDDTLKFYLSIEECLNENRPNVVVLSSSLQYVQKPKEIISALTIDSAKYMIIDRTPFSDAKSDQVVIQRVPKSIYEASYPMWIFSRAAFDAEIRERWSVVVNEMSKEGWARTDNGLKFFFQTLLLKKKHA